MGDAAQRRNEQPRAQVLLHAVAVSVADSENDLDLVLLQPRLFDPTWPTTVRFAAERVRVQHLVDSDPTSWLSTSRAEELRKSWFDLREEAGRVGLTDKPWRQRRTIRKARRLLQYARGERGSPAMRIRAYRQGLRLLDGIVSVPEPLRRSVYEAAALTPPLRTPGPDFPTYG